MSLKKKIFRDYKERLRGSNSLFIFHTSKIAKILFDAREKTVQIVTRELVHLGENTSYMHAIQKGVDRRITYDVLQVYEDAALEIKPIWHQAHRDMALYGRLVASFIARKNSPPWIPTKIDLASPMDGDSDLWMGQLHYQLKYLGGLVVRQVELGLVNKEPLHKILTRIKKVLGNDSAYVFKEEALNKTREEDNDKGDLIDTESLFGVPPIQVSTGVFNSDDVQRLQDEQVKAMDWESRRRDVSNREMWDLNGELRSLEQRFMSDSISSLHSGLLQIGTENMGITDYEWVTSKPQKKCDECSERDGLSMKEIKERGFTDNYRESPPPLHPNCRCQLVPILRDDWAKEVLQKNGIEWDDETGRTYFPSEQERAVGFESMSWNQWIKKVGSF